MKIILALIVLGLVIMACTGPAIEPATDNVAGDGIQEVDQLMNELDNLDAELNFDDLENLDLEFE